MKPSRGAARLAWTVVGVVLATVGALLQTPAQQPRQTAITALLPAGASLVLQAKDFASLLGDWNTSAEKTKWLASANYEAFSRSRLFLRLKGAYDEFSTAAGVPPDMALVSDVAGTESALALYDIGKLEFLYVTRLPSAKTMENALWRTRGDYEPRTAAGTPFYVRVDPESKRVVAFGVRDQYLVLATREDLLAGALTLIGGQGGSSVETDGRFAQAVKAAGAPGDVRLVADLETLVKEPHFRSYWVQESITELKQYSAAVSDLTRTPSEIREERVLLRAEDKPVAGNPADLGLVVRFVPDTAGLYRAWMAPPAEQATTLIFEKVIATSGAAAQRDRTAPRLGSGAVMALSGVDFESRINEEARAPRPTTYQMGALTQLVGSEPLTAMLHVEGTRLGSDGVFVDRGSVIMLMRSTDWPQGAARDAVRALVDPVWTKAHLGMRWIDEPAGAREHSRLEGLDSIAVAERGRVLFVANDPALLVAVLTASNPAIALEGTYAGGFRHALERSRFADLTRLVDHAAAGAENRGPLFFSENLASLSDTLSRVDSASIVVRDRGTTVSQTMTYRLGR